MLEGTKPVEEAYNSNIKIEYAFVLKEKAIKYKYLGDKIITTSEQVLKKISTTDTPPDIVAVGIKKNYDLKDLKNSKKVVLLENIRDYGNLGTILRTSVAFGADAIVLYGDSVDLYNPKCVRSSVGNLWKIPVVEIKDIQTIKSQFKDYRRIATLPRSKNYLKNYKTELPALVMFGSEADGLSEELIEWATDDIKIEMTETVESLNLSISCAVVLYKLFL